MNSNKKRRGFHLPPSAAAFVSEAKVMTDAGPDASTQASTTQDNAVQHSTEPSFPWDDLSAGNPGINFKPTPELYAMMAWCKANAPGGISFLEILRQGAEMKCRELIAKHYRPED
jgi:hypothetical protein